jgi:hypothetical protein
VNGSNQPQGKHAPENVKDDVVISFDNLMKPVKYANARKRLATRSYENQYERI